MFMHALETAQELVIQAIHMYSKDRCVQLNSTKYLPMSSCNYIITGVCCPAREGAGVEDHSGPNESKSNARTADRVRTTAADDR